jgi:ABC-2 type transport system ATP-binding protein
MLALAARLFGVERATARARSASLLDRLGLADRANDAISTLSGGMRRRLEMARALVHDPELLLLDEPTTGVDAGERMAVWQALRESRDGPAVGRTTLLASNDLAEADTVCDLVAFMGSGRIVATGTPHELKRELRRDSVRLTWAASANDLSTVRAWPGVGEVARDGDSVRLTADDASALVPRLFELAPGVIRGVTIEPATLEDAYFQHVGGRRTAVAGELR